jgi:hypothetical protein
VRGYGGGRGCGCGCGYEDGWVLMKMEEFALHCKQMLSHKGSPSAMETWWNTFFCLQEATVAL